MFGKIRPFIFKFDPETAHNLAIQALKFNLMPRNQKQNFKHIETEIFNKKYQIQLVLQQVLTKMQKFIIQFLD